MTASPAVRTVAPVVTAVVTARSGSLRTCAAAPLVGTTALARRSPVTLTAIVAAEVTPVVTTERRGAFAPVPAVVPLVPGATRPVSPGTVGSAVLTRVTGAVVLPTGRATIRRPVPATGPFSVRPASAPLLLVTPTRLMTARVAAPGRAAARVTIAVPTGVAVGTCLRSALVAPSVPSPGVAATLVAVVGALPATTVGTTGTAARPLAAGGALAPPGGTAAVRTARPLTVATPVSRSVSTRTRRTATVVPVPATVSALTVVTALATGAGVATGPALAPVTASLLGAGSTAPEVLVTPPGAVAVLVAAVVLARSVVAHVSVLL